MQLPTERLNVKRGVFGAEFAAQRRQTLPNNPLWAQNDPISAFFDRKMVAGRYSKSVQRLRGKCNLTIRSYLGYHIVPP